ncbi:hypothetical protein Tco_0421803 [Tanacetum coccineum]
MSEFKTKNPEGSSSNWKLLHNDWDATISNLLEDNASDDDLIFIVDPGWDDYCLKALKLNRPEMKDTHRQGRLMDSGYRNFHLGRFNFNALRQQSSHPGSTIKIESSSLASSSRRLRMALAASFAPKSSMSWATALHALDLSILIGA